MRLWAGFCLERMECAVVYIMYVNDLKGKFVKTPILMNGNRDSILESEIASAFHIDPLCLIRLDPSMAAAFHSEYSLHGSTDSSDAILPDEHRKNQVKSLLLQG